MTRLNPEKRRERLVDQQAKFGFLMELALPETLPRYLMIYKRTTWHIPMAILRQHEFELEKFLNNGHNFVIGQDHVIQILDLDTLDEYTPRPFVTLFRSREGPLEDV